MSKKFLFVFNELWLDQFVCWVVFLIVWMIECRVYFNVFQFILFLGTVLCVLALCDNEELPRRYAGCE